MRGITNAKSKSSISKIIITLTGTSGTLTDAQFAQVIDNSQVVEFNVGWKIYKFAEVLANSVAYTSETYPTTTTQMIKVLYINTSSEAVNYKTWSIEDIDLSSGAQWGSITGTLSNQTDLNTALTAKMDKANPTGTGSFSLNRKASTTIGTYSVAEGNITTASGNYSHAEGNETTAGGTGSHAEGYKTTTSSAYAHAEGRETTASGGSSHAEGISTIARGSGSHAEGYGTTAQGVSQHVFGEYNKLDTSGTASTRGTYVEIVGNGTLNARSNARTLDWSGNEVLSGTSTAKKFIGGLDYLTTAPTADNTDGLKIVVLSTEPQTRYNGYVYFITEA